MQSVAEVVGKFEAAGDCASLLYAPLPKPLTYRRTRRYEFDFEGDRAAVEAFVTKVLFDPVSQELHWDSEAALEGYSFWFDYGMKPGALDLEKETVCAYHAELEDPGFQLTSLKIKTRLYVFGDGGDSGAFVRDVANPAIHTWEVSGVGA